MTSIAFTQFLKSISSPTPPILDASIPKSKYVAIDLSVQNSELNHINISSSSVFSNYINSYLKKHNAQVAYGGYLEVRNIYKRSSHFSGIKNKRNIHLGLDLWCVAESSILAPIDGIVHSFKNNTNYGDYGPTIILEHCIYDVTFFTLYGHLSLHSILNLEIGQKIKRGDQIATLGNANVNGDYPPHLHFQIIKDLEGNIGDYPGVCARTNLKFYQENCPDPNILLGFDN